MTTYFDLVSVQNHLKNGSFTWACFEHFGPIQSRNLGSAAILQSKVNICTTPGDLEAQILKQTYCVLPPPASICVFVVGISRLDLLQVSPILMAEKWSRQFWRKDSVLKCSGKIIRASLHAPESKHLWLKVVFKGKLFSCNRGRVLRGGSWKKGSSVWLLLHCWKCLNTMTCIAKHLGSS